MGHIEDRWWKVVVDPVTKKRTRVKAARHGTGQRYRVRYLDPEGHERSVSFPDRQKKTAEDFLVRVEGDKRQGVYIDPSAGRLTFGEFVRTWLDSQTFDASTRRSCRFSTSASWGQSGPPMSERGSGACRNAT
jgi:hypothetical protein